MTSRHFRALFSLLLGVLLGGTAAYSYAGSVNLSLPSNVKLSGGSYVTSGPALFNGASFNSALTTQVGGKAVTVPAVWRLAANAPQIAMTALRFNPTGLLVSAVAAYLLTKGLTYINDQWMQDGASVPASYYPTSSMQADCAARCASQNGGSGCHATPVVEWAGSNSTGRDLRPWYGAMGMVCIFKWPNGTASDVAGEGTGLVCPLGTTQNGTQCIGAAVPATDQTWTNAQGQQLPDSVSSPLSDKLPLPLQPPIPNTTPQDIPLSDPRIDPLTGKPVRDVARVTPQLDGKTADVQVFEQPLNPDGTPATDPVTGNPVPPVENKDPCVENPNRLGCLDADMPSAPDITNEDRTITITPDGGWGASTASCPADRTMNLHGQTVAYSWSPVCTYAGIMRYPIIGFAWLTAVLIAVGMSQRYS